MNLIDLLFLFWVRILVVLFIVTQLPAVAATEKKLTTETTTAEGRCILYLDCAFTTSVTSKLLSRCLSAYLFVFCLALIPICTMLLYTEVATIPNHVSRKTAEVLFGILVSVPF